MTLSDFFAQNSSVALAFSGGVDSAYLLYAGVHYGADIRPYFIKTAFQPAFELEDAQRLAAQLNVPLTVIELDIFPYKAVIENPENRCYHCKMALFETLWQRVRQDGHTILIDGTNASDDAADRPGMQALQTLAVRSPLRECGLTKQMIRALSQQAALFTWDKPAYACLATRLPTGTSITPALLSKIEGAELALFALGFSDCRVRILGNGARIQLKSEQMDQALCLREQICQALRPYFEAVLLDLTPRSS